MKKVALIFVVSMAGCCPVLQQTASAVTIGVDAADRLLPPDADDDLAIAHGVAELGEAVADQCVEDGGWQQWVRLALEATTGLVQLFTGAANDEGNDPPPELLDAQRLLESQVAP